VQFTNDYLSEILLGALFLVVILFLPRGVLPTGPSGPQLAGLVPGPVGSRIARNRPRPMTATRTGPS